MPRRINTESKISKITELLLEGRGEWALSKELAPEWGMTQSNVRSLVQESKRRIIDEGRENLKILRQAAIHRTMRRLGELQALKKEVIKEEEIVRQTNADGAVSTVARVKKKAYDISVLVREEGKLEEFLAKIYGYTQPDTQVNVNAELRILKVVMPDGTETNYGIPEQNVEDLEPIEGDIVKGDE